MIELDYAAVGARISMYRRERGLSAAQLAQAVGGGLTREVLAKIENGNRSTLDLRTIASIAWALRLPLLALLFDIEHPRSSVQVDDQDVSVLTVLGRLQGWRKDPEEWAARSADAELIIRSLERYDAGLLRLRAIDETSAATDDANRRAELARSREDAIAHLLADVDLLRRLGVEIDVPH